ncbi:MAG: hypothetical protein MUF34_27200 [Polyangiaceae bacterium]|jgi:hypothetical protein|nr:hypothetical protein [Polyangiaceae bacterium]
MAAFVPLLLLALVALWAPRSRGMTPPKAAPQAIADAPRAAAGAAEVPDHVGPAPQADRPATPAPGALAAHGEGADTPSPNDAANAADAASPHDAPAVAGAVERIPLGTGAFLLVPSSLSPESGPYDLIVHFHGVTPPLERALGSSGLNAVLVDVTIGAGSGPYGTVVREGVVNLDQLVHKVERSMAHRSRGFATVHVNRIALSAWSAGYGAVLRLLSSPRVASRVDAILLADAPHAGFRDLRRREVEGAGLGPLLAYGRRAMRGETLLAITHSHIATIEYASTHETTDFIVRSLGLARRQSRAAGPGHMLRSSFVEQGSFSITGYEGVDAHAHGEHLRHLDATLFPRLKRRWGGPAIEQGTPEPPAAAPPAAL